MTGFDRRHSWGRLPGRRYWPSKQVWWRDESPSDGSACFIPRGNLRSYGDVADPSAGGTVADMRRLDRFISVDWETGVLRAEAGATMSAITRLALPAGWFLPVVPGTSFVTLGGAIANDVHGKNHVVAGSFGNHVRALGLQRTSWTDVPHVMGRIQDDFGARVIQPGDPLFAATVGGLGLTGVITWAEVQLRAVRSSAFEVEDLGFQCLADAQTAFLESSPAWEYVVAWIDATRGHRQQRRGWFTRARHLSDPDGRDSDRWVDPEPRIRFPPTPVSLINGPSARLFNAVVASKPRPKGVRVAGYAQVLFPLDSVSDWSRAYGPKGLFQHQCALPEATLLSGVEAVLGTIGRHRHPAVLGVLKWFGSAVAPSGLMSFPQPGGSFAVDMPNRGAGTSRLMADLDSVVADHGGRLYPAKDASMSAQTFQDGYPGWRGVEAMRDPQARSSFWDRVTRPL